MKRLRENHGLSKSSLYSRWRGVKRRCFDKTIGNYYLYGGRGITMCEEWKSFKNFYDWAIENGYREDLTLDRIDVNGNYCPENCRWVTHKIQSNNRRDNHFITYNNETHTIADWARKLNINLMTLNTRLNRNWSIERALTTPINYKNNKKGGIL